MKKIIMLLKTSLLFTVAFGALSCEKKSNETNAEGTVDKSWITSSLDFPSSYKYFEKNAITLEMAIGEFESFQLALSVGTADKITVSRESADPALNLQCCQLKKQFDGYEDVLVPTGETIHPDSSIVKLWITYETGRNIKPGTYEEKLKFTTSEGTKTIATKIIVKNITLPLTPSIPITFGIYQKVLSKSENVDEQIAKRKQYFELLLDHRISPYLVNWGAPNFHLYAQSSPYNWNDPRTADFIADPRFAAIALPYWDLTDEELKSTYDDVESKGLLSKSYVYFYDEPNSADDHVQVMAGVKRINAASPNLKINLTFYCGIDASSSNIFDVFNRYAAYPMIYSTSMWALNNSEVRAGLCAQSISANQEWWTYACCGTKPGFTFNTSPVGMRSLLWKSWKEKATGFLYWAVNDYLGVDPLVKNHNLKAGDGSLVFPGSEYGVDEPVASIRLERFRDSAEDYELLRMLEAKKGRDFVLQMLGRVYYGPESYTSNVDEVENFRLELMDNIEK